MAPASLAGRLYWAVYFAGVTAIRSGIGPFNLLEVMERVFGSRTMEVTGWLRTVANAQSFISLLLIGCLGYAYLL